MLAQGRNVHTAGACWRHHVTGDLTAPVALQLSHPEIQAFPSAAEYRLARGLALQRQKQGIVSIEDSQSAGLGVIEDLGLGRQSVLPAPEGLNMGIPDVGDAHHIRLSDPRKVIHLAGVVDPQLHHGDLMMALQPQ